MTWSFFWHWGGWIISGVVICILSAVRYVVGPTAPITTPKGPHRMSDPIVTTDPTIEPADPVEAAKPIELGDRVRDSHTGFSGICDARSQFLFGCERIHILPRGLKDGKPLAGEWFDIHMVERLGPGIRAKAQTAQLKDPGGPQDDNSRRSDSPMR